MGFLKKMRKRDDRFARVAKAKRLARAYGGAEAVSKAMAHDPMQVCAKVKEIEEAGLRMRFCGKNAMDIAKEIASATRRAEAANGVRSTASRQKSNPAGKKKASAVSA